MVILCRLVINVRPPVKARPPGVVLLGLRSPHWSFPTCIFWWDCEEVELPCYWSFPAFPFSWGGLKAWFPFPVLSWVLNPAGLDLAVLFNYLGMQIYFGPLMLNGKFSTASNPKWNFGLCLLLPLRGLLQPR